MAHRLSISPAFLGFLIATGITQQSPQTFAQVPPPPLPPGEGESEPAPESSSTPPEGLLSVQGSASTDGASASAETADAPAPAPAPAPEPWEQPVGGEIPESSTVAEPSDYERFAHKVSLRQHNSLNGGTGLHRVVEASSGAVGTFRMSLLGSYFGKSGFLCRDGVVCPDSVTGEDLGTDRARHSDLVVAISATPFSFLEAYFSLHNSVSGNSNGTPRLLNVVGDVHAGLKAFLPREADQIFYVGGSTDVHFFSGSGGVGPKGGATSFSLAALSTVDFYNRTEEQDRIPLRLHANLGYKFDNSGNIVRELEETEFPEGRGSPIERTERYGLTISRVDKLGIGLGAEYVNDWIRPYLEWTIDVPVNRQKYVCNIQEAASRGDECLGVAAGFATTPSRFSLGARLFPWQATGLALTGAFDLGTGGTRRFLEETTPEAPYRLWFGLAYSVDTVPPIPEKVEVASPYVGLQPEVRRYVLGQVVEQTSGAAVPDAIIRYQDVPMTGLVGDENGQFISQDLPPGEYTFHVYADQFRDNTCTVVIPETAPPAGTPAESTVPSTPPGEFAAVDETSAAPPTEAAETATDAAAPAEAPYLDEDGNLLVPLRCELKELPRVANVTGLLIDAATNSPVADAKVRITDHLHRSLELAVDAQGSFQFRNVPFGQARLTVTAPGYLTAVHPLSIESREALEPQVLMNKKPARLDVQIRAKDIILGKPIEFEPQSPEVTATSRVMVEQLAEALSESDNPEKVEIQVHTDDSGSPQYSRRLSQQRADRVVQLLTQLGVPPRRLTAKGYGPDQPLVPNVSEANRARNNRVQIIIP